MLSELVEVARNLKDLNPLKFLIPNSLESNARRFP